MKKMKKLIVAVLLFITTTVFAVSTVYAESTATMSISGSNQANVGESFKVEVLVNKIQGELMNIGGIVSSEDESCIALESITKIDALSMANNNRFVYSNMMGGSTDVHVVHLNLKAGNNTCTTNINITGGELSFTDGTKIKTTATLAISVVVPTPKSTDNTLKSLTPSKGTLSPAFSSSTTNYAIDVDATDTTVNFTAVPNDPKAKIKSGSSCKLSGNATNCKIVVQAEDGSTKTYTVTVNRPDPEPEDPTDDPTEPEDPTEPGDNKSSDASLKVLDVSGFNLSPSFSKDETNYELTVNNNITSLDVTAIPVDENATVDIKGNSNWKVGVNPVTITVTAEDGTKKTYIVNVTRKELGGSTTNTEPVKDSNNYLDDIEVTNGILSPSFDPKRTEYNITVPNSVTKLDLEPIKASDKATVQVSGNSNFQVGKINVVTIKVTAEDGKVRIYTINVTRSDKEANNKLDDIIIKNGTLDPVFDPDINRYVVEVDSNVKNLDISAIPHNPNSKVEIIGGDNLQEGNNKVRVIVTDENGLSTVYYLNVYKKSPKKFLGLTFKGWLTLLGCLLLLGLFLFLLFLLLKKKKKKEPAPVIEENSAPVIEFKPEFNFGSKNGTDDDYVEKGGVLNQYSGTTLPPQEQPKVIPMAQAAVRDVKPAEVYDPYDDVVTKDELFDAIAEAKETKDVEKLRVLYEQEELNRRKAELKAREDNNHTNRG